MAAPTRSLPYGPKFQSADEYISALLTFITGSNLHQALCGGVHILDFLTREPDLYSNLLSKEWRLWFANVAIDDILDLLLRENIEAFESGPSTWREYDVPPSTLLEFITQVRHLAFQRTHVQPVDHPSSKLDRQIAVGMNPKKEHEVSNFASFVASLTNDIAASSTASHRITHLVDFGSGQNYLGRVLAGPMFERHIVALESRPLNIEGARKMDVHAKLAKKTVTWRNKKMWHAEGRDTAEMDRLAALEQESNSLMSTDGMNSEEKITTPSAGHTSGNKVSNEIQQRITYIEHVIKDGDLSDVVRKLEKNINVNVVMNDNIRIPELLVMSLHSCGNLVHHGLRSLILNPAVKAVAMIGCCYNLCTERLGPPTYKLPGLRLRTANQRLQETSMTSDPHGFPMSARFLQYQQGQQVGTRLNITARMMAVQAPDNWTKADCEGFFTRHFFRALIQRIFLDKGFIDPPVPADEVIGGSVRGWVGGTEPIIIGSLTKACYKDFVSYVRGAVRKINNINPEQGSMLNKCFEDLTDEDIADYEKRYAHKRHELCVVWSLMAFAAQLIECAIVSDRWQFLIEQDETAMAWVQTVFSYKESPRNLVIVGIKK